MHFLSRIETLKYVLDRDASIIRYGDGEMMFALSGLHPAFKGIPFQKPAPLLAKKLMDLWKVEDEKLLLCYNHNFMFQSKVPVILNFENSKKEYANFETVREPNDVGILERSDWQKLYQLWYYVASQAHKKNVIGEANLLLARIFY